MTNRELCLDKRIEGDNLANDNCQYWIAQGISDGIRNYFEQTNNAYAALVRQYQMEQEVKAIVQKNDTPQNRKAQKAHPRPEKRN